MKAVLQYGASTGLRSRLSALAPEWLDIAVVDAGDKGGFAARMAEAEVLLHVLEPVTGPVMELAPRLRLIQKIGVGVNTIDLDAARARGVAVANMPGTNSQAVAEMTLALMLAALRRVAFLDRAMRRGDGWAAPVDVFDSTGEIAGRTAGLVGFGAVARRVAPVLVALGAKVLYFSRRPDPDAVGTWCPLDDLLARSDIVSLHLPLTADTAGVLDEDRLARMRPGSILVNTARGALVNEAALVRMLKSGRLAAAGLDVFAQEPAAMDNPLFALDNVVATPHVGWLTPETLERSLGVAIGNCERLRAGQPLRFQVVP